MIQRKNQNIVKSSTLVLLVFHMLFVIFVKYFINDIEFISFRLDYLGNIFNILLSLLIITGFSLGILFNKKIRKTDYYVIFYITVFLFFPLIVVMLVNGSGLSLGEGYLFGIPIKKLFLGILFFVEIFFQLYLLFAVWGFIIDREYFSHIRSIYISVISILCLLFFSFFYTMGYSDGLKYNQQDDNYDTAVILGAAVWSHNKPSPIFKGRIKKAFDLYNTGVVNKIQLTGGNAPGEISEAETAYNYLSELGVRSEDIIIEKSTSTTTEQVKFIKYDLIGNNQLEKVIIVSDGFHLSRILEICKFYDVEATGVSSDYKIKWEKLLFYRIRESIALLMFWFFAI